MPLTIGQVAKHSGIGLETVRFYERKGLIEEPPRTDSGYRQYPKDVVGRIRFIKRAKELGFSLKEISELLSLRVDPDTKCADVRKQTELKLELVASCVGTGPAGDCPILEALDSQKKEW